jgi:hypothetical protein
MGDGNNSFRKWIVRGLLGFAAVGVMGFGIVTIAVSGGAALPIVVGSILCCGGAAAGYLGIKITEYPTPNDAQTTQQETSAKKDNSQRENSRSQSKDRSASQEITIGKGAEGPSTKTNPEVQATASKMRNEFESNRNPSVSTSHLGTDRTQSKSTGLGA